MDFAEVFLELHHSSKNNDFSSLSLKLIKECIKQNGSSIFDELARRLLSKAELTYKDYNDVQFLLNVCKSTPYSEAIDKKLLELFVKSKNASINKLIIEYFILSENKSFLSILTFLKSEEGYDAYIKRILSKAQKNNLALTQEQANIFFEYLKTIEIERVPQYNSHFNLCDYVARYHPKGYELFEEQYKTLFKSRMPLIPHFINLAPFITTIKTCSNPELRLNLLKPLILHNNQRLNKKLVVEFPEAKKYLMIA